jgi:hypothetical protein
MRIISKIVTINEPNAMEPKERVEARKSDEIVGCFGMIPASLGPK